MVDVDLSPGDTMNKKIRNAQLDQYNYILGTLLLVIKSNFIERLIVVGEKEVSSKTVNVRTRDNVVHGEVTLSRLQERLLELKETRAIEDIGGF